MLENTTMFRTRLSKRTVFSIVSAFRTTNLLNGVFFFFFVFSTPIGHYNIITARIALPRNRGSNIL